MSSIFTLYKEVLAPSACTCCAFAHFTGPEDSNLITTSASVLRIYTVVYSESQDESEEGKKVYPRLNLIKEENLKGIVTSIGVVRIKPTSGSPSETDSLMFTFKNAKISLMEWCPENMSIITVSIHYYEREEFKRETFVDKYVPSIIVEPQSICTIMNFYTDKLAVIPFKGDPLDHISDKPESKISDNIFLPSYVISYSDLDKGIKSIISMTFVNSFFEPLLAVLHEPMRPYVSGMSSLDKEKKSLYFISFDPIQRTCKTLHKVNGLPYSCHRVIPITAPGVGVIVVSNNSLIYVDQISDPAAVCFNKYHHIEIDSVFNKNQPSKASDAASTPNSTTITQNYNLTDMSHLGLSLKGCELFPINPDTLLVVLITGRVILVHMLGDIDSGTGWNRRKDGVVKFSVDYTNIHLSPPSCGALIKGINYSEKTLNTRNTYDRSIFKNGRHSEYIFIGSSSSDHLLVGVDEILLSKPRLQNHESQTLNKKDYSDVSISNDANGLMDVDLPGTFNSNINQYDDDFDNIYGSDSETYISNDINNSQTLKGTMLANNNEKALSTSPILDEDKMDCDFQDKNGFHDTEYCHPDVDKTSQDLSTNDQPQNNATLPLTGVCKPEKSCDNPQVTTRFEIQVCDFIVTYSPMRDAVISKPIPRSAHSAPFMPPYEIVTCTGLNHSACLSIFQPGVSPIAHSTMQLHDVIGIWAIDDIRENVGGLDLYYQGESHIVDKKDEKPKVETSISSSILLVASEFSTEAYSINGGELKVFTDIDICRELKTINVKFIRDRRFVVQVHKKGIFIISAKDLKRISSIDLKDIDIISTEVEIVSCSILDEYVQVLLSDMSSTIFYLEHDTLNIKLLSTEYLLRNVTCCTLYCHNHTKYSKNFMTMKEVQGNKVDGLTDNEYSFAGSEDNLTGNENSLTGNENSKVSYTGEIGKTKENGNLSKMEVMDESDSSLYDEDIHHVNRHESFRKLDNFIKEGESCWAFCAFEDGSLEILSLPGLEQKFYTRSIYLKPNVLFDEFDSVQETNQKPAVSTKFIPSDINIISSGRSKEQEETYMIINCYNGGLLIYKAQFYKVAPKKLCKKDQFNRFSMVFSRVNFNYYVMTSDPHDQKRDAQKNPLDIIRRHKTTTFNKLGGNNSMVYDGAFIPGKYPTWIFFARSGGRGYSGYLSDRKSYAVPTENVKHIDPPPACGKNSASIQQHITNEPIIAFCPINLTGKKTGFCLVSEKCVLSICELDTSFNYQTQWPLSKIPLQRTPRKIAYNHTENVYVLATSRPAPFILSLAKNYAMNNTISSLIPSNKTEIDKSKTTDKQPEPINISRPKGTLVPDVEQFQLELITQNNYTTIEIVHMECHEYILALEMVKLDSLQSHTGRKMFVALGTGILRGEDIATRGRIIVYDIIKVKQREGSDDQTCKLKQLHLRMDKGPVSALGCVNGYLLAAVGSKILVYSFEDNSSLIGVAFMDSNTYITTVSVVKNYIFVGDVFKSVSFLCFQEDPYKLILLGKDCHNLPIHATNFVVHGKELGLTCADSKGNIHVMAYSPNHFQSSGGQKLLRRASINTGRTPCKLIRAKRLHTSQQELQSNIVDISRINKKDDTPAVNVTSDIAISINVEGGFSILVPLSERVYRRLHSIYSCMFSGLQHTAGLNPRTFRQTGQTEHPIISANAVPLSRTPGARFVLDGDLIYEYFSLGLTEQMNIAKGIGSLKNRVIEDLFNVIRGSVFF